MEHQRITATRVGSGVIWTAIWFLFGILLMGFGYVQQQTTALYVGVFVTFAGVLNAVVRLIVRGRL